MRQKRRFLYFIFQFPELYIPINPDSPSSVAEKLSMFIILYRRKCVNTIFFIFIFILHSYIYSPSCLFIFIFIHFRVYSFIYIRLLKSYVNLLFIIVIDGAGGFNCRSYFQNFFRIFLQNYNGLLIKLLDIFQGLVYNRFRRNILRHIGRKLVLK